MVANIKKLLFLQVTWKGRTCNPYDSLFHTEHFSSHPYIILLSSLTYHLPLVREYFGQSDLKKHNGLSPSAVASSLRKRTSLFFRLGEARS